MLNKAQIIDAIQEINVSAARDWLDKFDPKALHHYLDHLEHTQEPRGGHSIWVRRHETPAVVSHKPQD
jgi:hypothetical protein